MQIVERVECALIGRPRDEAALGWLQRLWRGGGGRRLVGKSWGAAETLKGMDTDQKEKPDTFDVIGGGQEQELLIVVGDMKMRVKRFAAKCRRDARATANLESSSDSVTEKIIETPMRHVNNPSACITKAVDRVKREKAMWEGEPVPEWDGEGAGGEWRGKPTACAAWHERDNGGKTETMRRSMAVEEARMVGEPSA